MKCRWKAPDKDLYCDREEFDNDGYCIYHKPQKNLIESRIFWALVNFDISNEKSDNILDNLYFEIEQFLEINQLIDEDIGNFTDGCFLLTRNNDLDHDSFIRKLNRLFRMKKIIRPNLDICDFRGFRFPNEATEKINFSLYEFYSDSFRFYDFSYATFEGSAFFNDIVFDHSLKFNQTKFNLLLNFQNSKILQNCTFNKTIFNDNYLYGDFGPFWRTQFNGKRLIFREISHAVPLDGIVISENTQFSLENYNYSSSRLDDAIQAYRIAKKHSLILGDKEAASVYYYKERVYSGKNILNKYNFWENIDGKKKLVIPKNFSYKIFLNDCFKKISDLASRWIMGYGEKPSRSLTFSLGVILLFSFFYFFTGLKVDELSPDKFRIIDYDFSISQIIYFFKDFSLANIKQLFIDYSNFLYFSTVTFTTVGYGDMTPINFMGKLFSAIEMLLGITLAGIWVATLLRKMMS